MSKYSYMFDLKNLYYKNKKASAQFLLISFNIIFTLIIINGGLRNFQD